MSDRTRRWITGAFLRATPPAWHTAAGTTATQVTRSFYDGLGRKIQVKAESALNAQSIVVGRGIHARVRA